MPVQKPSRSRSTGRERGRRPDREGWRQAGHPGDAPLRSLREVASRRGRAGISTYGQQRGGAAVRPKRASPARIPASNQPRPARLCSAMPGMIQRAKADRISAKPQRPRPQPARKVRRHAAARQAARIGAAGIAALGGPAGPSGPLSPARHGNGRAEYAAAGGDPRGRRAARASRHGRARPAYQRDGRDQPRDGRQTARAIIRCARGPRRAPALRVVRITPAPAALNRQGARAL